MAGFFRHKLTGPTDAKESAGAGVKGKRLVYFLVNQSSGEVRILEILSEKTERFEVLTRCDNSTVLQANPRIPRGNQPIPHREEIGVIERGAADFQGGLVAGGGDMDEVEVEEAAAVLGEDFELDLAEVGGPVARHIPGELVRLAGGDVGAELVGRALGETGDRNDIRQRIAAIFERQRRRLHRGIVGILHPILHIHERSPRPPFLRNDRRQRQRIRRLRMHRAEGALPDADHAVTMGGNQIAGFGFGHGAPSSRPDLDPFTLRIADADYISIQPVVPTCYISIEIARYAQQSIA